MKRKNVLRLTQGAMIVALAYIGFQFLRIDIPVGTERTAVHMGNSFVVLGALLLGGGWGGLAGALGLTLADLTSGYVTSAPKTFLLKLLIGFLAGLVARRIFQIEKETSVAKQSRIALFAALLSLGVNVAADPLFGYFYKAYLFGIPQDMAATLSKIGSLTTLVNAAVSTLIVTVAWTALYPALHKGRLLPWQEAEEAEAEPPAQKET